MANNLASLELEEVSLCDFPSNAEVAPRTGKKVPRSVVALRKRDSRYLDRDAMLAHMSAVEKSRRKEADDPGEQFVSPGEPTSNQLSSASIPGWLPVKKSKRKGKTKMKKKEMFQQVLKTASGTNRRDKIVTAVQLEARRIAKKTGVSVQKAEADVWKANEQAQAAYESAKLPDLQPERKTIKLTNAEVELHRRARKLMKQSIGMSYAQACSKSLEEDPSLYDQYTKETASGKFIDVPDSFQGNEVVVKSDDSDDEDECENCGADVDEDDLYCGKCGRKL